MSRSTAPGFTLLEVIVAVFVFAIVMSALIGLVSQNVRRTADARDDLRATRLAEVKLREILFEAENGQLPDLGTNQGNFEGDDEDMAFEVSVEPYEVPFPRGAPKKVLTGSGIFAGGGEPALRRVVLKVFRTANDPEQASPFVAFVAEPNPAAAPTPGQAQEEQAEQQQPEGQELPNETSE